MQIEPQTKIVQAHFGGQTSLKTRQIMRPFPRQTKGIQLFVSDRLDDLPQTRQPAPQRLRPMELFALLMRGCHDFHLILLLPARLRVGSCKPFIGNRSSVGRQATAGQGRRWCCSQRKQGLGQQLIVGGSRAKAKAGNHPARGHRKPHMEAFIPSQPITPATIRLTRQPSCSSPFRITGHGCCAIERLIKAFLRLHQLDQKESERGDGISMGSLQPIELGAIGQARKGSAQMMFGKAIKGSFDFQNCTHCPNTDRVITSLQVKEAGRPALLGWSGKRDW